jgi:hypothetical protein
MSGASLGPWGAVGGAVLGGISGLLGSRSARKQRQEQERRDQERRAAYNWYGGEMTNLANRYGEDSKFNAVGVRTGFGRSYRDPQTGEMVSELDPRYSQMRDQYGNLFQSEYDRMMNFDPEALAADRYAKMQKLVAGNRADQQEGMFGTLLRKGLIGAGATDGTGRVSNPLMAGMQRGWADEDTKMALESMGFADARRVQGLGLLSGLSGNMMGIDARGDNLMDQSYKWSGMTNTHNLNALGAQYDMYGQGLRGMLQGRLPAEFVSDARNQETAGRYGMYQGLVQGFGQAIPKVWGLFNQPGTANGVPSMAPSNIGLVGQGVMGY